MPSRWRIKPISHVATHEATQDTLALLKILALGRRQMERGKAIPFAEAARRLRARRARRR